jgi:membrane peptidoglycan carboxypeptidase
MDMWAAFGQSINTYFVPLEERAGAANVVETAKKMGIQFRASSDAAIANNKASADQWGAFTLGVSSATPLEMANAYATIAADGKYCEPIPVQEIVDQDGNKLDIANPRCEQRIKTEAARAAADAARCPVGDRSSTSRCKGATARQAKAEVGKPIMGKSGTTDSAKTASLILGTKQLMVAGIVADPDWAQTSTHFTHDEVNDAVWSTVRDAMKGKPSQQFTPPNGKIVEGDQRRIPDVKCKTIDDARSTLRSAGFEVFVDNVQVNSTCPAGTVAGTSPDGRTIKGGIVSIQISNGKGAQKPGNTPPSRGPGGRPIFPPPPRN